MRYVVVAVAVALALYFGEWVYRSFVRPVDPPTQRMSELSQHFNERGIKGHIYPVRHGYRHSEVVAAAAFQIEGYPLPISLAESPSEASAKAQLESIQESPNLMHPLRNGTLVMHLPMWGEGTEPIAVKVKDAFVSFKPET